MNLGALQVIYIYTYIIYINYIYINLDMRINALCLRGLRCTFQFGNPRPSVILKTPPLGHMPVLGLSRYAVNCLILLLLIIKEKGNASRWCLKISEWTLASAVSWLQSEVLACPAVTDTSFMVNAYISNTDRFLFRCTRKDENLPRPAAIDEGLEQHCIFIFSALSKFKITLLQAQCSFNLVIFIYCYF